VPADAEPTAALMLASLVFVTILGLGDTVWCACAGFARPMLARYAVLRNRLTGGFLIASGIGLALARRGG
jgi:threonine/homoserine/homoserine lactone efflux protein